MKAGACLLAGNGLGYEKGVTSEQGGRAAHTKLARPANRPSVTGSPLGRARGYGVG